MNVGPDVSSDSPDPATSEDPRPWEEIRLDTRVELLDRAFVIALRDDEYVAMGIASDARRSLSSIHMADVLSWRNGGEWPRFHSRSVPTFTTVESAALAHGLSPLRAFRLPRLLWRGPLPPRVVDGNARISLAEAVARLPAQGNPRAAAVDDVAEIRALYGRMLADIAYRIENSALFDSAVPTTRQFETALALWADVHEGTTDEEVTRRAVMVDIAFRTARSHAETVGFGHLPAASHNSARRAAGAARLAQSSPSGAERDAAHLRVVSILRSLSLSCLPDPSDLPLAITTGVADPSAQSG